MALLWWKLCHGVVAFVVAGNFFDGGQKSLVGFCVLVNAGYVFV